jgi:hypothetical protein
VANNLARFRRWAKGLADGVAGRKRTEITVETDRVLIIRRRWTVRFWCQECGCEVDMVGVAEAEAITGKTGSMLYEYAEARGWHLAETSDQATLVCLKSLRKFL